MSTHYLSKLFPVQLDVNIPLSVSVESQLRAISVDPYLPILAIHTGLKKIIIDPPYTFELSVIGTTTTYGEIRLNPDNQNIQQTLFHELGHLLYNTMDKLRKAKMLSLVASRYHWMSKESIDYMHRVHVDDVFETIADLVSLIHNLPSEIRSFICEHPGSAPYYPDRPEHANTPKQVEKQVISWDQLVKDNGGYLTQDHDLEEMIEAHGDIYLSIKDANGGRHRMPASDVVLLLNNRVCNGYIRSINVIPQTALFTFRLDMYTLAARNDFLDAIKIALPHRFSSERTLKPPSNPRVLDNYNDGMIPGSVYIERPSKEGSERNILD